MNKTRVNDGILYGKEAIEKFEISDKNKEVLRTFRGQISTFGAAVTMGSLKSAVAFFAAQGNSDVDRPKLLKAMYYVIKKIQDNNYEYNKDDFEPVKIFEYICQNDNNKTKEKFIDASISIKLAMNLFRLVDKKNSKGKEDKTTDTAANDSKDNQENENTLSENS